MPNNDLIKHWMKRMHLVMSILRFKFTVGLMQIHNIPFFLHKRVWLNDSMWIPWVLLSYYLMQSLERTDLFFVFSAPGLLVSDFRLWSQSCWTSITTIVCIYSLCVAGVVMPKECWHICPSLWIVLYSRVTQWTLTSKRVSLNINSMLAWRESVNVQVCWWSRSV